MTKAVTCCDNADDLIKALEAAGRTLLAMKEIGFHPGLAQRRHDIVRAFRLGDYGDDAARMRPAAPSAADIARMDEVYEWVLLIPECKATLRRVVHLRSLVHPVNDRHLFSWRKIAAMIGTDHKAVQRWHEQSINLILKGLPKRPTNQYEFSHVTEMCS